MRFSFCGGLDVPDWLLSEIFVLSKISALRFKLLAGHIVQLLSGHEVAPAKLAKLLGDAKFDAQDLKAISAAVQFILGSAARYSVGEDVLGQELQQLGLPREHADGVVNAYRDGRSGMQDHARARSLRLPRLSSLTWRVVEDKSGAAAHAVELQLGLQEQAAPGSDEGQLRLRVPSQTFDIMLAELKRGREAMQTVPWGGA